MMIQPPPIAGFVALLFAATGCLPAFMTLQRPTTLEPGQVQVGVAPGVMGAVGRPFERAPTGPAPEPDPNNPSSPSDGFIVPNVDLVLRRGLLPNVDAGLRFWLAGVGLAADVKWRFVHTEQLQLAIAPAIGIDLISILGALANDNTAGALIAGYLPIVAGIRTGPHQLLVGARVVAAAYTLNTASGTSAAPLFLPGAMLGYDFEVLPSLHVVPEVNAHCATFGSGCLVSGAVAFWFP